MKAAADIGVDSNGGAWPGSWARRTAWLLLLSMFAVAILLNSEPYYPGLMTILAVCAGPLAAICARAGVVLVVGTPALDSYAIIFADPQVVTVFQVALVGSLSGEALRWLRSRKRQAINLTLWDCGIILLWVASAVSVVQSFDTARSVVATIQIAALSGMYFFLSRRARDSAVWNDLFLAVVVSGAISALVALGQAFSAEPLVPLLEYHPTGNPVVAERVSGFFANPNTFAVKLVLVVILLAEAAVLAGSRLYRVGWVALALLCGLALGLTYSRQAWVGLAAGGAILVFTIVKGRRARATWLAVAVFAGAALLALPGTQDRIASALSFSADPSARDRIYLSQVSVRMFQDLPVSGVGKGAFMAAYPSYKDSRVTVDPVTDGHQMPFSLPAETGLLGLLSGLLMVGALVLALARAPKLTSSGERMAGIAAVGAFAVMSLFNVFWFNEAFWVSLALVGVLFIHVSLGPTLRLPQSPADEG